MCIVQFSKGKTADETKTKTKQSVDNKIRENTNTDKATIKFSSLGVSKSIDRNQQLVIF